MKTWIDKSTNLEWTIEKSRDFETWNTAMDYPADHLEDDSWKLPTIKEFITIIDFSKKKNAFKKEFPLKNSDLFWSITEYADNPKQSAWTIDMKNGHAYPTDKQNKRFVICVRSVK